MIGRTRTWGSRAAATLTIVVLCTAPAFAAVNPHGAATAAGVRDILLGAAAATGLMAAMAAIIAASWRGFRTALRVPSSAAEDPFDWRDRRP
jgi:hypothetical protein